MKIYLITGKSKSGKTTFGNILKEELKEYGEKPCVMQITSTIYHYAEDFFEWDPRKDEKPREFLQKFGIELLREKLNKKTFLLNRCQEDIEILKEFFDTFIITDVRFLDEIKYFKKEYKEVTVIKMDRFNYKNNLTKEQREHITEKEVDLIEDYDYLVENEVLADLKRYAKEIAKAEEGDVNE